VKYASFCAARSACVVIPEAYEDGGPNQLSDLKKKTIKEAAAFALSPVSPTGGLLPGAQALAYSAEYWVGIQLISQPVLQRHLSGSFARWDIWAAKFGSALLQTDVELVDSD